LNPGLKVWNPLKSITRFTSRLGSAVGKKEKFLDFCGESWEEKNEIQ
jgi:hypothetical protein